MIYDGCCVTQKVMSQMMGASVSKISRILSSVKEHPIKNTEGKKLKYSIETSRKILKKDFQNINIKNKVQSFYNFKGGTGKTTLCFQVATNLAVMGFNVLAIDSDPQGHLSRSFGLLQEENFLTLFDVIASKVAIQDVVKQVFLGLDCIPSNLSLTRLENYLNQVPKREEQVLKILESFNNRYDFIIFDTNPTISFLNKNILTCSHQVNIVCETQPYSLNGLNILIEDMSIFFRNMSMNMPKMFIIPNKYEDRTSSSAESMTILRNHYSDYMEENFAIRKSEEFNTSAKNSIPICFFCKSNSIAFEDINDLVKIIIRKSST